MSARVFKARNSSRRVDAFFDKRIDITKNTDGKVIVSCFPANLREIAINPRTEWQSCRYSQTNTSLPLEQRQKTKFTLPSCIILTLAFGCCTFPVNLSARHRRSNYAKFPRRTVLSNPPPCSVRCISRTFSRQPSSIFSKLSVNTSICQYGID